MAIVKRSLSSVVESRAVSGKADKSVGFPRRPAGPVISKAMTLFTISPAPSFCIDIAIANY
jgi:hypothetical protein